MMTVKRPFNRGVWHITHDDDDVFYILFQSPGHEPQIMFICKGAEIFSALAECATTMYAELHPEVKWDGPMLDAVMDALKE